MSAIIVAGAGHGGLVAAIKLAEAGNDVTVYEKQAMGEYHLDQKDSFDASAMEFAGIEIPDHYRAENNRLTFVPSGASTPRLTMPENTENVTLTVERKEFHGYLLTLAKNAGAKIQYETSILSPIVLGSRVAGIRTDKGDYYADLIIDACGISSPLRSAMPDFTSIERDIAPYDVLHTYRAYFENKKDVPDPETKYNVYLTDDGTVGLSWLVTDGECTDALIARFHETPFNALAPTLLYLNRDNPNMGTKLMRGGYFVDIPVRQPLAVFVADGYAAVGDSAFMTYALKGSGLAYSIRAGKMLADAVLKDENGFYNAENLWDYESAFFRDTGFGACRIAIGKNLLPFLTAQDVDDMFSKGLVSTDELGAFAENAVETVIKSKVIPLIRSKLHILSDIPELRSKLLTVVSNIGRFTALEPSFPDKYDRDDVKKWAEKYNTFFDSIRYKDETPPAETEE